MYKVIEKLNDCNILKKCCKKRNIILTKEDINAIEDECGICLDKLKNGPCLKTEKCHHVFHISCYKKYLQYNKNIETKCPMCYSSQNYVNNILLNY